MSIQVLKPIRIHLILAFLVILLALMLPSTTAFAQESCGLQATLVNESDYTKTQEAKAIFGKGWSIRNNGRCDWPRDLALVLVSGDRMSGPSRMPLNGVAPGKLLDINIDLQAPQKAGQYAGVWQLEGDGVRFGPRLAVSISVFEAVVDTDLPSDPPGSYVPGPVDSQGGLPPEIVTYVSEEIILVEPGEYASGQVMCEEGVVTGGGWELNADFGGARVHESIPLYGGWLVSVFNYGYETNAFNVYVNCLVNTVATQLILFNVSPVAPDTNGDFITFCPAGTTLGGGGLGMPPSVGMFMGRNMPTAGGGWRATVQNQSGVVTYDMLVFANCLIGLDATQEVYSEVFYVMPSSPTAAHYGIEAAACPANSLPASGGNGETSEAQYYKLVPSADGWYVSLLNEWLIELNFRVSVNCLTFP